MAAGLEIHDAASTGDYDSLEEYLRSGKFDVNMKDEEWNNRTALHWACAKGYVECIRLLLEHGAIGTSRTDVGWTPAHFAAETGKLTALRALYAANVPIGLKDKYGDSPRRIAEMYGHIECVKFFDQVVADEAAGIFVRPFSPKYAPKPRRSTRISLSSSISLPRSRSPTPVSSPVAMSPVNGSAIDEQTAKGINNNEEYVHDQDRESWQTANIQTL